MATTDELKVYRDEGEEEQQVSENNLKELKNSLVDELAEEENSQHAKGPTEVAKGRPPDPAALNGHRLEQYLRLGGYVMAPYPGMPYSSLPMLNHVPISPSMLMYSPMENFQPPPAHMGISRPMHHPHLKSGLPLYPSFPPGQFGPFAPEFHGQYPWNAAEMYRLHSMPHHMSHIPPPTYSVSPPPPAQPRADSSQTGVNHIQPEQESSSSSQASESKQQHIKKPLNAFMLYMKEKRAEVMEEFRLKESAQINQVLGKRWHQLSREEQAKYYEMASREKDEHHQKYPEWTARENYAINAKKKKRKRDKSVDADGNNPKKCRARYGLEKQDKWCKPCRRKKKCIRYRFESASTSECPDSSPEDSLSRLSDGDSGNVEDEGPSSVSSVSSVPTPTAPHLMEDPHSGPLVT